MSTKRSTPSDRLPARRRRPEPVEATRPHPAAWDAALELAGGDKRRLRTLPDGSVRVINSD
jgi:hypothetical protein